MGYWIEVRCCKQSSRHCFSAKQTDMLMTFTANSTMISIYHSIIELSRDAKKAGWKECKSGWLCPECRKEQK